MNDVDKKIFDTNKVIEKNIHKFDDSERGLLSQNILAQLRNLVEYIFLKIYNQRKNLSLEPKYENFRTAEKFVKAIGTLSFLGKFHNLLQISASHYTLDENASERLMLKYYEYLLKIKSFLLKEYDMEVFSNINEFPIKLDKNTQEYYEKIAEKINIPLLSQIHKDRYYIQKIKPFFVNNEVYYEVTFTKSHDRVSKFDRIIAFTNLDITQNYAVHLFIGKGYIEILGKQMPINIIQDWEVSIRPCELDNFARLFGTYIEVRSNHKEYKELMQFLTQTGFSLNEYVIVEQSYYDFIKNKITDGSKIQIFDILDSCRELLLHNRAGSNIIRYLLYIMNNKIIKSQRHNESNSQLSNLLLKWGCIPFEQMPFTTSLINHNPRIYDLFECISYENREHEFLARFIENNTTIKGELFTSMKEVENFDNLNTTIKKYNNLIYRKTQSNRLIELHKDSFLYIKGYKENTLEIIKKLEALSHEGIENYSNFVKSWLEETDHKIDCEDKKKFLKTMFINSKIAMIYGAAGTGKSTMINHISNLFKDHKKIYLAQTNPATDNLERKVDASHCEFMTITKFLYKKNTDTKYPILFLDESSTVSNSDMLAVLNKASFSLLVLVGDIFQIEAIRFGNWFEISKEFLPNNTIFELTKPWRSKNDDLLELWDKVRRLKDDISEHIQRNGYSTNLDESIFENHKDDEIILCLNYDGLYGINNINRFLQANNSNQPIEWGTLIYKVNDPILFNETKRFGDAIYNNLKGKIVDIKILDKQIKFEIEIDKVVTELDTLLHDFEFVSSDSNRSVISFKVNQFKTTDEDDDSSDAIVPFQVAYAVSIHKAQGLEYSSVKIVITDEVEEQITHNIFYTAITRAKEDLKIYWSPETENKILKDLKRRNNQKDVGLLRGIMSS
ncbi:ATP-dependent RecD-like DNA helicase [Sulfurimonas sp. C5]|uniref:ATP-dependent DNA helicase n=1 Tax=Sulfurimonas sp. C5 TaxID=3036947 RepID=UPI002456390A|nr:ATP-dependent RecD-like DNA helicase [Sulfurimonas sp. C5]MDH4945299.1 ATP-dependent RecD-like DNA helicase [Sulfurimonas sp. C5]